MVSWDWVKRAALGLVVLGLAGCFQPSDTAKTPQSGEASPATATGADSLAPFARPTKTGTGTGTGTPGQFDYYLLALSWSPTYCADQDNAARDSLQCGTDRRFAFIVHGLWPQNERGYPQDCPTTVQDLPAPLVESMLDIMPAPGLIRHEWRRHGSCTGLAPEAYFATTRQFRDRVVIPTAYRALEAPLQVTGTEVETAFVRANPGLTPDGITVTCGRNRLREVRVCFDKAGAFRACGAEVRDSCASDRVTMPPTRPGRGRSQAGAKGQP